MDFEKWMSEQDEETRTAFDGHIAGLKSALDAERDARSKLEKQISTQGDLTQKLETAQSQLTDQTRKAEFYEAAAGAGVNDLKLAFVAAKEGQLFDEGGKPDLAGLAAAHPSLFVSAEPGEARGNAGKGTRQNPKAKAETMDTVIRRTAGVLSR